MLATAEGSQLNRYNSTKHNGITMKTRALSDDHFLTFLTSAVTHIYSANRTIESICRYFGATSGCLWELNRQSDESNFNLSAMYNRPDLVDIVNEKSAKRKTAYKIKYNIKNDNTVSSRTFRERMPAIGNLGEDPFSGSWLEKEHTRGLSSLGVKKIALVPIFDKRNKPVCSVSLYTSDDFNNLDQHKLKNFSKFFSALWVNSHVKMLNMELETSSMRHEITGSLLPIENSIKKLDARKADISRAFPDEKIPTVLDDISAKIKSIQSTLGDSRLYDRVKRNKGGAYFIDLRQELNSVIQPIIRPLRHSVLSLDSIYYPRSGLQIYMHGSDFEQLFRNIITNAVKYSVPGSSIRVQIGEAKESLSVTVSNLSRPMPEPEWRLIWEPRYRSEAVQREDTDGDGLGLYVARVICRVYGFSYRFFQEAGREVETGTNVWSRVRLMIPKDMVR